MIRAKQIFMAGMVLFLGLVPASGQILNKIKQKASKKAEQVLDKKLGLGDDNSSNSQGTTNAPGPWETPETPATAAITPAIPKEGG